MLVSTIEEASIKPMTKHLMLWQLHTIVRPAEASNARWEEIDFDKKLWGNPGWPHEKEQTALSSTHKSNYRNPTGSEAPQRSFRAYLYFGHQSSETSELSDREHGIKAHGILKTKSCHMDSERLRVQP